MWLSRAILTFVLLLCALVLVWFIFHAVANPTRWSSGPGALTACDTEALQYRQLPDYQTSLAYRAFDPNTPISLTPIYMIHGRGANQDTFCATARILKNQGYRLITLDMPAHGRSDFSGDIDAINVTYMVDVIEAFRQAENHRQIALLGHSLGGVIALAYTETYPHQVSHLSIVGTHIELHSVPPTLRSIDSYLRQVMGNGYWMAWYNRWLFGSEGSNDEISYLFLPKFQDRARDLALIQSLGAYDYRGPLQVNMSGQFALITTPHDDLVNNYLEPSIEFAQAHGRVVEMDGDALAHYPMLADPEAFADAYLASRGF